jgi:hypothetical protein
MQQVGVQTNKKTFKLMINQVYRNYIKETEGNVKRNATSFWNFMRNKRSRSGLSNQAMTLYNTALENSKSIADDFASFVKSVYATHPSSYEISGSAELQHLIHFL